MSRSRWLLCAFFSFQLGQAACSAGAAGDDQGANGKGDSPYGTCDGCKVIVFVWDGLRPDSIDQATTPNLYQLSQTGVMFSDHHSTYPTFTMMNAASLATGGFPGTTGFFGNTFWQPGAMGNDSAGHAVDFNQPVFSEDYAILRALDSYYQGKLLLVGSLFESAQKSGKKTVAVGKSGAAFLQDRLQGGLILDEKMAYPLDFAKELQSAGLALPKTAPLAYNAGDLVLGANNGDPTAPGPKVLLADGVSTDASDAGGSPYNAPNRYLMDVYLSYILPQKDPDLSVVWMRNPDTTEHNYGVGAPNAIDALRAQDDLLGRLLARLSELGIQDRTDVIVVSDHAHSTVSGDTDLFPLRSIQGKNVGGADPNGFSVSGYVRLADLLTRAGFTAFDGSGCVNDPVLSGLKADGTPVYAVLTDTDGTVCGMAGRKYTTPAYKVPATLPSAPAPNGTHPVIVAANGGSDYLYVPDYDASTVAQVVRFLQSRMEVGAVFVDESYGALPGTLPLSAIHVADPANRHPDIVASFAFHEGSVVQGFPGTEYSSVPNTRGMHGSFSPRDVHNTLIAQGPHFQSGAVDALPTGNVDVAPTIARILGLELHKADGRPLDEVLRGVSPKSYSVESQLMLPVTPASGLSMKVPTDPAGGDVDDTRSSYTIEMQVKVVRHNGHRYTYFDSARAVRQ